MCSRPGISYKLPPRQRIVYAIQEQEHTVLPYKVVHIATCSKPLRLLRSYHVGIAQRSSAVTKLNIRISSVLTQLDFSIGAS